MTNAAGPQTVLLLGTLDTKGEECAFVRDLIRARGHDVLVMDLGIRQDPAFEPDVGASEVAEAGGSTLAALRESGDRGAAIDVMSKGACVLTPRLFEEGRFGGVLGIGGGGGTVMATGAMRQLPVGVPKLMVSTMASGNTSPYVDVKDVSMMYSVVDIAGLNPISRVILSNAAGAVVGMVEQQLPTAEDRPMIAATMFGVTTPCVDEARRLLARHGFDVLVFHATGSGGRAMEGLIDDGYFEGVLDVTTTEWCDEVVGGVLSAGPDRLSAAGRNGIPQVVSVGALDMVNYGPEESVPEEFRGRNLYRHNAAVTLLRTNVAECSEIGRRIAEQLNAATGPVVLVLPLKGVSMIDAVGQPFHDPEADQALFDSLRSQVEDHVDVVEVDAHINDPEFASRLVDELLRVINL